MATQLSPCCFKALRWREGQKGLSNYRVLQQLGRGRSRQQPGPAWSGEASWGRCLCRGLPAPAPARRHRPASGVHAAGLQRAHPAVTAAGVAACLPSFLFLTTHGTRMGRSPGWEHGDLCCKAQPVLEDRLTAPNPHAHGKSRALLHLNALNFIRGRTTPQVCPSFSWKAKRRPAGTLQPLHSRRTGPAKG